MQKLIPYGKAYKYLGLSRAVFDRDIRPALRAASVGRRLLFSIKDLDAVVRDESTQTATLDASPLALLLRSLARLRKHCRRTASATRTKAKRQTRNAAKREFQS